MLRLYGHPLSTFCMKVAMALYEAQTPFQHELVDFGDEASRARFYALAPLGKMPVLVDEDRGETVPETSIIIDYLASVDPAAARLMPSDPALAWKVRLADRIFDLHLQTPMQKIIDDRLRPDEAKDPFGVEQARGQLGRTLDVLERGRDRQSWAVGEDFTFADCSAAPALFYADKVVPFERSHAAMWAYFERLKARPSFARVLAEAEPYFHMYPAEA
ncbi:MAG: glutathione S-transferase family protein [Alphaproteobacteria bacterium]|nr:glutathione S-transferase family protein [Alphaproteobacteria bacterium]